MTSADVPTAGTDAWAEAGLDRSRARRVLVLTSVGFFITALDFTIVNVAFRSIRDEYGAGSERWLPWSLSGYSIAFAAGLLTAGRMADSFGRKRAFLTGNIVFALGSLVCVLPAVEWLVAGRVVQALGGALLVPTATALLIPEYPVSERARVFGVTAAMASVAAGLGPAVGGVLTSQLGWRWVFLINLPIAAITVVAGRRLLRESRDPGASARPDLLGAALAFAAVGLLTLAIVESERWGWASWQEATTLALAVVLGAGFIRRCRSTPEPVLDLSLLRLRFVWSANLANLLWAMGFYATYFTNVGWLQDVWGFSPQRSGLAYVPGPVVATLASLLLTAVLRPLGPVKVVAPATLAIGMVSALFAATSDERQQYATHFLPMILLLGLSVGVVIPVISGAANAYLPATRFAMGSALYTTGRQVGAALGVAIASSLQTVSPGVAGLRHSLIYVAIMMTATAAVMTIAYRRPSDADLARSAAS